MFIRFVSIFLNFIFFGKPEVLSVSIKIILPLCFHKTKESEETAGCVRSELVLFLHK
jgi:hypothetical protein